MPEKNGLQRAISTSYTILGSLALFGILGYWLDLRTGSGNFWLIVGLILGAIVGLYGLGKYILK